MSEKMKDNLSCLLGLAIGMAIAYFSPFQFPGMRATSSMRFGLLLYGCFVFPMRYLMKKTQNSIFQYLINIVLFSILGMIVMKYLLLV